MSDRVKVNLPVAVNMYVSSRQRQFYDFGQNKMKPTTTIQRKSIKHVCKIFIIATIFKYSC